MNAPLAWLDFDFSDDGEGQGSFDAMAAATPAQWPELQAELLRVLDWAHRAFGPPRPLEEGGEWDVELQGTREVATTLHVAYVPGERELDLRAGTTGEPRTTVSLTLTGTPAFCDAFRQAFAA